MKNIENKNFKNEKELAQDFDNQLKWLKNEVENKDNNKDKAQNILKEEKGVEEFDQFDFKWELDALKKIVWKNIDNNEIKNIEKMLEASENTWDRWQVKTPNTKFKYKLDENRESEVNKNIDNAVMGVDKYIASVPWFLGNWMRKIMSTEK